MTNKTSAKPSALRWALRLFWFSIVLGVIKLGLTLSYTAPGVSPGMSVVAFVAIYAIMSLLVVYVAMGARWARIALLLWFFIAIAPAVVLVMQHFWLMPAAALLTLAQATAQAVGFFLVFRLASQSSGGDIAV